MSWWLQRLLSLTFIVGLSGSVQAADPASMQPSEIEALQRRLTDAKCYAGPIDGQPSDDVTKAIAACPDQNPVLRIETGMHVAPSKRIGVDRACTIAATGSYDKTVRLWSLPEGRLLRTLRVPIGAGNNGKIFAVALSPDGRFLAAGGWDAQWEKTGAMAVYIFDAASGDLKARVGRFEDVTNHLAFSADGHWLVATLGGSHGVRMIDATTWTEAASDKAYGDQAYGADFGPDGRLYTVALDGKLRRYAPGPAFRKEREIATGGGRRPNSVALDPSGRLVAVGFYESTKVDVYDAQTLAFRYGANTAGVDNGDLGSVAWANDGQRLAAGGQYHAQRQNEWIYPTLSFARDGRKLAAPLSIARDTIFDLKPCGAGFAFATGDPALGLLGADGALTLWKSGVASDMRAKYGDGFALSDDAKTMRFGLGVGAAIPVTFDLMAATLTEAPAIPNGLIQAQSEGLPVTNFRDRHDPQFAGKPIVLENYEMARSLAIRKDRTGFALAADYSLRSFDAAGRERWKWPTPGGVTWGVNLSADGRIVVAAYGDGTIRWHRWTDGQELLALFINRDTKAWVAWTPSGYYEASPGAEDMIGWHLNRGWDQAADFFPASRFRDTFDRPDIVGLVLDTLDEAEAVRQANETAKRREDQKTIIERLPPVINILSPADGTVIDAGTVDIRYSTRSPSGAPVDRIEAFVDGAKVGARGLIRVNQDAAADKIGSRAETSASITLPMPTHDATISLVAYTGGLARDAVRISLKRKQEANPVIEDAALKPTLYALLIGVTHYENSKFDLGYPAQDASDLAEALKLQKGKLYKQVEVKVLTDKEATTTAIKRGLSWLRKQTTSHDLAIVFAAGHGTTDAKGKFWFLTYDMDPDDVSATALSRDDIADVLFDLPGKKLLFLDACHSGAALNAGARGGTDVSAAVSDFAQAEGGVVAYAASTGREFSFERPEWGHGAFTKALIEAFQGKADLLHKGTVTTATLDLFLEDRVKELTGGQQHPVMTRPKTVPDFPIALAQ